VVSPVFCLMDLIPKFEQFHTSEYSKIKDELCCKILTFVLLVSARIYVNIYKFLSLQELVLRGIGRKTIVLSEQSLVLIV
jgi:hypothetical protein